MKPILDIAGRASSSMESSPSRGSPIPKGSPSTPTGRSGAAPRSATSSASRPTARVTARMGATGGFALGIAFDSAGNCFVCDLKHAAVFRYDAAIRQDREFASRHQGAQLSRSSMRSEAISTCPTPPAIPASASIATISATGKGGVWCEGPTRFANGMAMAPDGKGLYVVESNVPRVSYVAIGDDGAAGALTEVVADVQNVPDGLAFAPGRHALHFLLRAEPHLSPEARRFAGALDRGPRLDRPVAPDQHRPEGRPHVHGQPRPLAHHRDRSFGLGVRRRRPATSRQISRTSPRSRRRPPGGRRSGPRYRPFPPRA